MGKERSKFIALNSPNCCCEGKKVSPHSPGPIEGHELIARFAFVPLHFTKAGAVKPNLFSQVFTDGCSIQRESLATQQELSKWMGDLLRDNSKFIWRGVLTAKCSDLRGINADAKNIGRSVCVYDTALSVNTSHGEIFAADSTIDEADELEIKAELMKCFDSENLIHPQQYQNGFVWNSLSTEYQERR